MSKILDCANREMRKPSPGTRLGRRRSLATGLAIVMAGSLLAACSPSPASTPNASPDAGIPSYYPDSYTDMIKESESEGGRLVIYSNMTTDAWQPVFDGFQSKYPWVNDISVNDMKGDEVFQRYYNEEATGQPAADLLVAASPGNWATFAEKEFALDYASPEIEHLPDFGQVFPGIYTFSTDPLVMAYNTAILPEDKRPSGLASLAKLSKANPDLYKNKISTYDGTLGFGTTANMTHIAAFEDTWSSLDATLPNVRPEASGGSMSEKLQTGEYVAAYFVSAISTIPVAEQFPNLIGWEFMDDGTVLVPTTMAIPKTAPHSSTAKLLLDFIVSVEGQEAVFAGGFTPYRGDLNVPRTYASIVEEVGEENLAIVPYTNPSPEDVAKFQARWSGAF